MSTYRIADVAERSGFTPATLRYYEDIGLMAPAARTDAGYRLYDDASLERLRFIARAKQLGCTLNEITDLATAWDGGECGPVQDRLRATVEAKVSEAHARIAALTSFTTDLRRAAAALSSHRPDGPCDDDCGCTTDARSDHPPVACTLGAGEMSTRLDGGIRLEFGPNTDVAELARLAAAEQRCCRFFDFALIIDARGVALEVHAPPDAADVVTALFGAAASGVREWEST
jgi:MerR family copper efflux transcriptional regulator